jgi:hypothetical protein
MPIGREYGNAMCFAFLVPTQVFINKALATSHLYETTQAQILLDDDVIDRSHDEFNLVGVCGACEMCVDLFGGMLIEATGKSGQSLLDLKVAEQAKLLTKRSD